MKITIWPGINVTIPFKDRASDFCSPDWDTLLRQYPAYRTAAIAAHGQAADFRSFFQYAAKELVKGGAEYESADKMMERYFAHKGLRDFEMLASEYKGL